MDGRVPLIAVAFVVGIEVASLIPGVSPSVRQLVGLQPVGAPSLANTPLRLRSPSLRMARLGRRRAPSGWNCLLVYPKLTAVKAAEMLREAGR
jgi:hypothetical protein